MVKKKQVFVCPLGAEVPVSGDKDVSVPPDSGGYLFFFLNRKATISLLNYTKRGGEGGSCGARPQPWPHPGLALSERRGSEGDPGIRQGRDGQDMRLGCRCEEEEATRGNGERGGE